MLIINNGKSMLITYDELYSLIERLMLSFNNSSEGEQYLETPIGTIRDIAFEDFYNCEYIYRFGTSIQGWCGRTERKYDDDYIRNIIIFFVLRHRDSNYYPEGEFFLPDTYIVTINEETESKVFTEKGYKLDEYKPAYTGLRVRPLYIDDKSVINNCEFTISDFITDKFAHCKVYEDIDRICEYIKLTKDEVSKYITDIAQLLYPYSDEDNPYELLQSLQVFLKHFDADEQIIIAKIKDKRETPYPSSYAPHYGYCFRPSKAFGRTISEWKKDTKTITVKELYEYALKHGLADTPISVKGDRVNSISTTTGDHNIQYVNLCTGGYISVADYISEQEWRND